MRIGGKLVSGDCTFKAPLSGKKIAVKTIYAGETVGVNLDKLTPAKESYLYKRQHKRRMLVAPQNVTTLGEITRITVAGVGFKYDKKVGKIVPDFADQKPFVIREGDTIAYDGVIDDGGRNKKFKASVPITFKK